MRTIDTKLKDNFEKKLCVNTQEQNSFYSVCNREYNYSDIRVFVMIGGQKG